MDIPNEIILVDLLCRQLTGKSLPMDCLMTVRYFLKKRRKKQKKEKNIYCDFVDRGSRVKRSKTKTRIKRAARFIPYTS